MADGKVVMGWIPMPFGGMSVVQQPFFDSFFGFLTYDTRNRNVFGGYTFASSGYIPASRNMMVQTFLERTESEWLLMLDWDISYKPHDVYALLDAADPNKIICGCYVTYFGDGNLLRPCWFEQRDEHEYVPCDEFNTGEIRELSACGMGFTLMHRDALLKMERADNDDPWSWFGHDVIGADRTGEDLSFCQRARRCGLTIWGHGGVLLGHTKARTFVPQDIVDPSLGRVQFVPQKRVLNVGGGSKEIGIPDTYDGWEHVLLDIKPGLDVDLVCDAREMERSVWPETFDSVYCSHNIEHYEVHDVGKVLRGMYLALKPGGFVHIQCPNFERVRQMVEEEGRPLDEIAYESGSGPIRLSDILFGFSKQIEESGEPYYMHRTAITSDFLTQELKKVGFEEVNVVTEGLELAAGAKKPEQGGADAVDHVDRS